MDSWTVVIRRFFDVFPIGAGGLMYLAGIASVALVLFVTVYAHGESSESAGQHKKSLD